MQTIQVYEHETLTTHPDDLGRKITPGQFEKLCQFNDTHGNKFFTVIRSGVRFSHYVGIIRIGNLTIEILPKADMVKKEEKNREDYDRWRRVLLQMLAISGYLQMDSVSQTYLKKRHYTLLDLYFEIFLNEMEKILRRGPVKKYRQNSSNLHVLKGRIDFARNIQKNLIHQERFYTTHQQYDYEHLINQILLKGLMILHNITSDASLLSRISKILFYFPEIKEIPVNKTSFDRIRLDRKTEFYSRALEIAKMLILNYSPDISKGGEDMLALLFDMNLLWERYIYKRLKQYERDGNYKVTYQEGKLFWENRRVRPDLVIRKDHETIVLDTKWRLAEPGKPSDDELKQMYVYNLYWEAQRCILLYPDTGNKPDGKYGRFHKGIQGKHYCKVGFVNILDDRHELNREVAREIIKKIWMAIILIQIDES